MTRTLLAVLTLPLLAAPAAATAAPGDPDRRFGSRGVVTIGALDGGGVGALDRRGHVLVAGGIARPGVARLTARGRRDRRFGARGIALSARRDLSPFGVRRGRDGRIRIAARTVGVGTPPVELLRFGARGRPLRTRIHRDVLTGGIAAGVQRPNGGAYVLTSGGEVRALAPGGGTDTAFAGGTVDVRALAGEGSTMTSLALRRDGSVVVGGSRAGGGLVLQLTRAGRLDGRFGQGGVATTPVPVDVVRVARRGDVVGATGAPRPAAFRLTRAGRLRRAFGNGGVARAGSGVPASCCAVARDVAEDGRRRLYVLAEDERALDSVIAGFDRAGRIARRFGGAGVVELTHPRLFDFPVGSDLLVDRRGGLLAIGTLFRDSPRRPPCQEREDLCRPAPPPGRGTASLGVWRFRLR